VREGVGERVKRLALFFCLMVVNLVFATVIVHVAIVCIVFKVVECTWKESKLS